MLVNMLLLARKWLDPIAVLYEQVMSSSLLCYLLSWSLLAGSSYTKTLDELEIHVDLMSYISYV